MNKTTTQMSKGITLLILVLNVYMSYPIFDTSLVSGYGWRVGNFCELSLALFAILIGYEYHSFKEKNIRYGMKRIWGLFKIYWLSLAFIELPLLLMGTDEEMFVLQGFLENLIGLSMIQEWHIWFVFLFIMAMLGLPYLCSRFEKKVWAGLAAGIVLPYILFGLVKLIPIYEKNYVLQDLAQCFLYFPCIVVGYLLARYQVFEKADEWIRWKVAVAILGIAGVILLRSITYQQIGNLLDILYAVVFLWSLSQFVKYGSEVNWLRKLLSKLGKYAAGVWIYYTIVYSMYIIQILSSLGGTIKSWVLLYLIGVAISFAGAWLHQKIARSNVNIEERYEKGN